MRALAGVVPDGGCSGGGAGAGLGEPEPEASGVVRAFGGPADSLARVHGVSERYAAGSGCLWPALGVSTSTGGARPVAPSLAGARAAVAGEQRGGDGLQAGGVDGAVPVDLSEAVRAIADAFAGAPQPASWLAWVSGGVSADGAGEQRRCSRKGAPAAVPALSASRMARYELTDAVSVGGASVRASAASLRASLAAASSVRRMRLGAARCRASASAARAALVRWEACEGLGPRGHGVRRLSAALAPAAGTLAAWGAALDEAARAVASAAARAAARSGTPEALGVRLGHVRRVADLFERLQRGRGEALAAEVLWAAQAEGLDDSQVVDAVGGNDSGKSNGPEASLAGRVATGPTTPGAEAVAASAIFASRGGLSPLFSALPECSRLPALAGELLAGLRLAAERASLRDGCAEGCAASETLARALLAALRPACASLDVFLDGDGDGEVDLGCEAGEARQSRPGASAPSASLRVPLVLPFAPRVESAFASATQCSERYWETPRDGGSARFAQRERDGGDRNVLGSAGHLALSSQERPLFSARGGVPGVLAVPGRRWRGEDLQLLAAGGEAAQANLAVAVRGERLRERRRELGLPCLGPADGEGGDGASLAWAVGELATWSRDLEARGSVSTERRRGARRSSPPLLATPFRTTVLDDEDDDAAARHLEASGARSAARGALGTRGALRGVHGSRRLEALAVSCEPDDGAVDPYGRASCAEWRGTRARASTDGPEARSPPPDASSAATVGAGLDDLVAALSRANPGAHARGEHEAAPHRAVAVSDALLASNGERIAVPTSAAAPSVPRTAHASAGNEARPGPARRPPTVVPPLRLAAAANALAKKTALAAGSGLPSAEAGPLTSARIAAARTSSSDEAFEADQWYSARGDRPVGDDFANEGALGDSNRREAPPFASHRASAGSWLLDGAEVAERVRVLGPLARPSAGASALGARPDAGPGLEGSLLYGSEDPLSGSSEDPLSALADADADASGRPLQSSTLVPVPPTPPPGRPGEGAGSLSVPMRLRASTTAEEEANAWAWQPLTTVGDRHDGVAGTTIPGDRREAAPVAPVSSRGSWIAPPLEMPALPRMDDPLDDWPLEALLCSPCPRPQTSAENRPWESVVFDSTPAQSQATFPDVPASARSGLLEIAAASARRAAARGASLAFAASPAPSVAALPPLEAGGEGGARRAPVLVGARMAACAAVWDDDWTGNEAETGAKVSRTLGTEMGRGLGDGDGNSGRGDDLDAATEPAPSLEPWTYGEGLERTQVVTFAEEPFSGPGGRSVACIAELDGDLRRPLHGDAPTAEARCSPCSSSSTSSFSTVSSISLDARLPSYAVEIAARLEQDLPPIGAPERRRRRQGERRIAARWRDERAVDASRRQHDGDGLRLEKASPRLGGALSCGLLDFAGGYRIALPLPPLVVLLETRLARRALSRAAAVERVRMDRLRRSGLAAQVACVLAALLPGAPGRRAVDAQLRVAAAAGASPEEAAARVQDDVEDLASWHPVGRFRIRVTVAEDELETKTTSANAATRTQSGGDGEGSGNDDESAKRPRAEDDANANARLRYGPGAGWLQRLRYAVELDPCSPFAELLGADAQAVLSRLGDAARLAAQLDWALEDADAIGSVRCGASAARGARSRKGRIAAACNPHVIGLRTELRALAWGARQLTLFRTCTAAKTLETALQTAPAAEDAREAMRRASAEIAPGSRGVGIAERSSSAGSPLEAVARGELVGALDAGGAAAAAHRAEVSAAAHVRMRTEEIESVQVGAEQQVVDHRRSVGADSRSESDAEDDSGEPLPQLVDRWWETDEATEVEAAKAAREAAKLAQRHASEAFAQAIARFRRRRVLLFRVLRTLANEPGEPGARAAETLASLDFSRFYQNIDGTAS